MSLVVITSHCYADNSKIEVRGSIDDGETTLQDTGLIVKYFTSGARQQQTVTLTGSAFTNIAIPASSDAVLIDIGTNTGLKLKGVTGDTGISLDSACPILLPISADDASTTFGILNLTSTSKQVKVYFF